MPEQVTPQNRLGRLIMQLGMESDATADDVLNKLGAVLKALGMDPTTDEQGGAVLKKAMALLSETAGEQREQAKVDAMSEYKLAPGVMIAACSTFVSQTLKNRHLPGLSDDEREQVDLMVPRRR